jgi:tRNA1(Val) A37 N6-methylase TrmN6
MRFIHPKRDKNATVVMISARKSSKSKVKCLPPLITHENGEFSDEVKEIYDKLSIKSLKCELDG